MQIIRNNKEQPVGRAAIWKEEEWGFTNTQGVVTVGGFYACNLNGIIGVLVGSSLTAARDSAVPLVPLPNFRVWAKKELESRLREGHGSDVLTAIACVSCSLGIEPSNLPIARSDSGWVTPEEVEAIASTIDEALLVHDAAVNLKESEDSKVLLNRGVFTVSMMYLPILTSRDSRFVKQHLLLWPPLDDIDEWGRKILPPRTCVGSIVRALARGWDCPLADVVKASHFSDDGEERVERPIGKIGIEPILERVDVIRRPSPSGSNESSGS